MTENKFAQACVKERERMGGDDGDVLIACVEDAKRSAYELLLKLGVMVETMKVGTPAYDGLVAVYGEDVAAATMKFVSSYGYTVATLSDQFSHRFNVETKEVTNV